jgi:signal transduction histidine kinase
MALPPSAPWLSPMDLSRLADQLARRKPQSPMEEVELQNRELLKIHQALREKQAELELADERKNQFVTTLAHELRNPLATLAMTLEVLRRRPDLEPDELARRVAVMTRQTTQLTQLVDDLLDIARVSQGKVELRMEPVDLNTLAAQSLEMTGSAIEAKDHSVALHLHPTPLWVSADAGRIKQVICNLVQNSARYTAAHGAITIRVGRQAASGFVEVIDNGSGISADVLPHIFGLFVQGDVTHAGGEGGLGVGLSLVRRLVQDHGGTVEAASGGAGQGSRFTVALPLVAAPT